MGSEGIGKTLHSALNRLKQFWQKQEKARKRLIVVLAIAVLTLAGFLVWMLNATQYTMLYTNLTPQDAGEMLNELESMGVVAKPQGSNTILVPEEQVDWVRMELAASGFPKSSTNLDILQQGSGFGITEEDKAVYRRYQLQEDLQNAIKTFGNVVDARVSLIIPRESAFLIESQQIPATAAVLLTLDPGTELNSGNVQAISELVQKSVPNLKPEGVTIIDSNMRVLNVDNSSEAFTAQDRQSMEREVADRLKQQIMALLQPVFGPGSVLSEVSVSLNFDESYIETVRFEPSAGMTTGMVASIDEIREASYRNMDGNGEAGTGENGAAIPIYPVVETEDAVYEQNSQRINYEINTIKEQLVKAQGDISNLSVSVILDSNQITGIDYSDSVRQLVASAVGVDAEHITVQSLPFQSDAALDNAFSDYTQIQEKAMQLEQIRFFLVFGSAIVLILVLFFAIVRLIRGKKPTRDDEIYDIFPSFDPENKAARMLTGSAVEGQLESQTGQSDDKLAIAAVQQNTEKTAINQYIEDNPELVVSVLRGWMAEEQGRA